MKHQALFSLKDRSEKNKSVDCYNFCLALCLFIKSILIVAE